MRKLLEELVHADAPPGRENEVQVILQRELSPWTDELTVDVLGNVIARKHGESERTFMLVAHQDEDWALMTTHIDEKGFIRFKRLVGHRWNLLGQRVTVHGKKGKVQGIVGLTAPHLIPVKKQMEGYRPEDEQMFIDCGARSRKEAVELGITVGQFITAQKNFSELAGGRFLGNCFDDRVGLAVMIEALKQLQDKSLTMGLVVVASVQEEVGIRGAQTASYIVQPDYAIALDVAPTGDHQEKRHRQSGPRRLPVPPSAGRSFASR